jgi:hypothetical protein
MRPTRPRLSRRQGFAASGCGALLVVLALAGPAAAQAPGVVINGAPLVLQHPALLREGVVLLPLRELCASLGAQARWYPEERKIELRQGETFVELWVMTPVAQINHNPVQLTTPPVLCEGVTYLPLRLVGQAFGCVVRWDAPTRTVSFTLPQ